ncbi:helix-turn-helix domain-containing protein [Halorussus gelatinilyticus]|uniref:Helix-turn-helix domain-containing protein n=1 Tax=Halorussus gelatinilyticus TaxID=2937524 RepID=A0A8U0IEG1_9EURY|nr:helix-turn-helix domain-containing protein [Halorussus gelatinilyticus]UPV99456.1 helix-turn-helix domain-containing protein [Halorussus gelatinilyticus]
MIDITMDMEQYDCPFIDTTDDHAVGFSAIQWDFDRVNDRLETRMMVEGESRGALSDGLSTLRDHENMHDYALLTRRDNVAHIRTVIGETDAMETVRDNDGYITGPFHIEEGSEVWHVGFDGIKETDTTLSELDRGNEYEVIDRKNTELPQMQDFVQNAGAAMTLIEGCRDLSDVERETLETAVSDGYFENPRGATLGHLADEFDVSKPAVSKNLRRGQQKMIQRVVEALDELE